MWSQSRQALPVNIVEWSLVLSSDSESVLLVCDGDEDGLKSVDVLEDDSGTGGICVSSIGMVCRVPFFATRCVSNWSMQDSAGRDSHEIGLEWALEGPEKGL